MGGFFKQHRHFLWLTGGFYLYLGTTSPARAQVVPDGTLPNQTIVIPNGAINVIEGGTRVGDSLFHSFQEFSVPTGSEAFFNNALDVQTILSRVTGDNRSLLEGSLRANGTANLFLLNPNGISFGPKAQLKLGGSFLGSTASSLQFADGSEFSATNPQAPPLLTINTPVGLQFGQNPASIVNQSVADSALTGTPRAGLETPGRTLALLGGDLLLEGGNLTAFQGQIELGSVASGFVSLTPTTTGFTFGYQGIQDFGRISLTGAAAVNVSGLGGGTIRVRGGEVSLSQGAKLVAETYGDFNGGGVDLQATQLRLEDRAFVSTSTYGSGTGGSLTIRADGVEISGTAPLETSQQLLTGTFNPLNLKDGLFSLSVGSGTAGALSIDTDRLIVKDGVNILTTALVNGKGGEIVLNVSELAELTNGSLVLTGTAGSGDAGNLAIATQQLRVLDGTALSTTPASTATGQGGNLSVMAESVELRGTPVGAVVPDGLFTTTLGAGDAGDLMLVADQLLVADGAQVSASSTGGGRAGNLTVVADSVRLNGISVDGQFLSGLFTSTSLLIVSGQPGMAAAGDLSLTARQLSVDNGAQISAATGSDGEAGDLTVNVSESIEVSGFATGVQPSVEAVSFGPLDGIVPSAIETNTRGPGDAGDLMIQTGQLIVRDGAEIGVRSTGSGSAGKLAVTADSILLSEQGTISAVNVAGTGGNIELNAQRIQLNNGIINASTLGAGTGDLAQGGDITITTAQLDIRNGGEVSVSSQGSGAAGDISVNADSVFLDNGAITANSYLGQGGNIRLQVQDDLVLRNRSAISTRAGTEVTGGGDGGNITIDTGVLAVLEKSQINANAFSGTGGNIRISTRGIFVASDSAITASSTLGVDGVVEVSQLAVSPSQGLVELPESFAENSDRITTGCPANQGNSFVVTGRGGLPEDPTQTLRGQTLWQDLRAVADTSTTEASQSVLHSPNPQQPTRLIEANGWVIHPTGQVELVAYASGVTPRSLPQPASCSKPG